MVFYGVVSQNLQNVLATSILVMVICSRAGWLQLQNLLHFPPLPPILEQESLLYGARSLCLKHSSQSSEDPQELVFSVMPQQQSSFSVVCMDGRCRTAPAGTQPSGVAFSYTPGKSPRALICSLCLGTVLLTPGQWGSHRGQVTAGSREQDAEGTQRALQLGSAGVYFLLSLFTKC